MNDVSKPIVSFMGLMLPAICPSCGAGVEREHRFHATSGKPPQLTLEFPCGTVLTRMYVNETETHTNVSAGCRASTLKELVDA